MRRLSAALVLLAPLALGCGKSETPAPAAPAAAAPTTIDNARLGLRVTSLPAGFRLVENQGERLVFEASSDGIPATLIVAVGAPEPSGINLVELTKSYGAAAAAAAGGKFFGGTEMVTPSGPAYTARALVDGGTVEERRVFLLHPGGGDRLVTLTLRYPPSEAEASRARMQQTIDLLSVLEPLPAPPAAS